MRYADRIKALTKSAPAHHVEAWMRLEHGTLDHLSPIAFENEVADAAEVAIIAGEAESEALAASYGLTA